MYVIWIWLENKSQGNCIWYIRLCCIHCTDILYWYVKYVLERLCNEQSNVSIGYMFTSSTVHFSLQSQGWEPPTGKNTSTMLESSAVALLQNFGATVCAPKLCGAMQCHNSILRLKTPCGKTVYRTSYLHQQEWNGCSGKTAQNN